MYSERETEYLLKAISAFRRRMIVVSPDFEILASNYNSEKKPDADIIGKCCHEVFYNRDAPCINCAVEEVRKKGRPVLMPKPDKTLDVSRLPCYYAYPIYSDGEIEAFVSMDFDVPTWGGLQKKLEESNVLLRNFILSAVDGVVAADKKGKILMFNEAAKQVFGYSIKEALDDLNIRSDEYGGAGKLRSYQVDILTKNRETIPISLNAAIIYDGVQEVATIGFFHDLREMLHMEEELKNTQLQLLQAEKMASLGKLAAGVAHQLNNPLGGITLFTKLVLEEYELEEAAREDLNRILKDAQRCRDTVKELLEFTRQTRSLMRPHDINRAIERTLFLLENQTLFHNIEIDTRLSADLPWVPGDIQQLNHLLMNVILNAAQAMEGSGKLTISTRLTAIGNHARIEISDTGPGIAEEILPKIFDPFFTTKEEGKGTGLGLSLVYGIVDNHDGKVRARNNPGGGAAFVIDLPLTMKTNGGNDSGE